MDEIRLVRWIRELMECNEMWRFYKCKEFMELRIKIFNEFHNECAICRSKGRITKCNTLHHHYHVDEYPQYALSEWVIDDEGNRVRNLIPLCDRCHLFEAHPEKLEKMKEERDKRLSRNRFNEERW